MTFMVLFALNSNFDNSIHDFNGSGLICSILLLIWFCFNLILDWIYAAISWNWDALTICWLFCLGRLEDQNVCSDKVKNIKLQASFELKWVLPCLEEDIHHLFNPIILPKNAVMEPSTGIHFELFPASKITIIHQLFVQVFFWNFLSTVVSYPIRKIFIPWWFNGFEDSKIERLQEVRRMWWQQNYGNCSIFVDCTVSLLAFRLCKHILSQFKQQNIN